MLSNRDQNVNQPLDSYQFEVLERQRIRLDSEIARRLDYIDRIISSPVSERFPLMMN